MKYIQRKNLNFSTFKSDQMRFWQQNWKKNSANCEPKIDVLSELLGRIIKVPIFWKRPVWRNRKIPYFLDKACLVKTRKSLFLSKKKSPYFKQTSVLSIQIFNLTICVEESINPARNYENGP